MPHENPYPRRHSGYLRNVFSPRANDIIDEVIEKIRATGMLTYTDAFAGCGMSGIIVASKLAYATKRELIAVRKANVSSHASEKVEGVIGSNYVFVDDFVASGNTLRHTIHSIQKQDNSSNCVGAVLYGTWDEKEYKDDERSLTIITKENVHDWLKQNYVLQALTS